MTSTYVSFNATRRSNARFAFVAACALTAAIVAGVLLVTTEASPMQSGIRTSARPTMGIRHMPGANFGGLSRRQGCKNANLRSIFSSAAFELPPLPWDKEALKPHMSPETIDFHYGKHHAAYVNKINDIVTGTDKESKSLTELILEEKSGGLFNSAAQAYNHEFFWKCLSPSGGGQPSGAIAEAITKDFGSFEEFKKAYDAAAVGHFGSGWVWLVKDGSGKLSIMDTHDAETPITKGLTPILTTDVWEHAYYIDYRNARPKYISDGWWNLVNWDFANENYAA